MSQKELPLMTIKALSGLIRRKEISPVELTKTVLERIDRLNSKLNAYVTLTADLALKEAGEAEQAIMRGLYLGPMHGIPIGHKDLYFTKGIRTTACSKLMLNFVPEFDATAVARWKKAGAILLGKLNTHEFAYGPTNEVSYFGPARNPWDLERMTGGSSGGSGAAVLTGLALAATGSDTGGSIRIPSSCCGVVGIKPTYGRSSRYGVFTLCWSLDHTGPMTKSVEDAALTLQPLAGYDPNDPASADVPVPDYSKALAFDVRGVRLGIPREYFFDQADFEVEAAVSKAIQVLEGLGARAEEVSIPSMKYAASAALLIYLSEALAYHEPYYQTRPDEYTDLTRTFLDLGNYVLAKDYIHAQQLRRRLLKEVEAVFQRVDVLVTPTLPIAAPKIGQGTVLVRGKEEGTFGTLLRFTEPFNLTGLPALSLPCGFSRENLPIGLQIVGKPFDEAMVLRVGHAYETNTEWHLRKPPVI